jgi:hypothetical protein
MGKRGREKKGAGVEKAAELDAAKQGVVKTTVTSMLEST